MYKKLFNKINIYLFFIFFCMETGSDSSSGSDSDSFSDSTFYLEVPA